MTHIAINAVNDRLSLPRGVVRAVAGLPEGAPIVILVHGFKFSPTTRRARFDPHQHILSLTPRARCWKAMSWPRHLGFGADPSTGLCIAFGWQARGSIWSAWRRGAATADALARLLTRLRRISPNPIHVMAHSLGAHVVLSALPKLAPTAAPRRVILLAGAAFGYQARAALSSPAGRVAEFVNVSSRENDLFDAMFERAIHPLAGHRVLGAGLSGFGFANWVDLEIDAAPMLAHFAALGHPIRGHAKRICHWSAYLRPGLMGFYAALMREPDRLVLGALCPPEVNRLSPRWSRLWLRGPRAT